MKTYISLKWATVAILFGCALASAFYAFDRLDAFFLELTAILVAAVVIPISYHDCGLIYRRKSRADKDTVIDGVRLSFSCLPAFAIFLLIMWSAIRFKYL